MADTIELSLNIQNSLNKTLKETQATMKTFNSLLEESGKEFKGISKTGEIVRDRYVDIEKYSKRVEEHTKGWGTDLSAVKNTALKIVGIFTGGFLGGIVKDAFELGTAMKQLSFRMGEAGKTAGELRDATFKVANAAGIGVKEASALVGELRRLRVPTKDIGELGSVTAQFSEVTGISADNAGRLAGELVKAGKFGVSATKGMLTAMANMQREVGMSEGEMEQLNETIITSTRVLGQYGKSAAQIETFNKGVIKLAGSFSAVGVSVERATQLIDKMMDPTSIEDNALLYTKMGISIQDAISGNIDPAKLQEGLKRVGGEIKNMGYAGAILAKQMGSSMTEMKSFAEIDLSKTTEGTKDVAGMFAEQLSPEQKFQKAMVELKNVITDLVSQFTSSGFMESLSSLAKSLADKLPPALKTIEKVVRFISDPKVWIVGALALIGIALLLRKKFKEVAGNIREDITTAVAGGIQMGADKAKATATMAPPAAARGAAATSVSRITMGSSYKDTQATAKTFDTMARSNLFPSIARMTQHTADWLRDISMGGKKFSLLAIKTEENNKVIKDRLMFAKEENAMLVKMHGEEASRFKDQKGVNEARLVHLRSQGKLSREEAWELKNLGLQQKKIQGIIDKEEKSITNEKARYEKIFNHQVRRLGPEQQKQMYQELKAEREKVDAALKGENIRKDELQMSKKIMKSREDDLNKELKTLQGKGKLNDKSYKRYQEINAEVKHLTVQLTGMEAEEKDIEKSINDQTIGLQKTEKEMKDLLVITKKEAHEMDGLSNPVISSKWHRLGDFVKSTFHKAGSEIAEGFDKAKNSAKQIVTNFAQKLNPANLFKGLTARLRGGGGEDPATKANTSALGKLGGLLGKFSVPLMLIAALLPIIQPVIDRLKKGLETLGPMFNDLINQLMPVIDALIPAIIALVKMLLPPLIKVLGYLLVIVGKLVQVLTKIFTFLLELPMNIKFLFENVINGIKRIFGGGLSEEKLKKRQEEQMAGYHKTLGPIFGFIDMLDGVGKQIEEAGWNMAKSSYNLAATSKYATSEDAAAGGSAGTAGIVTAKDGALSRTSYGVKAIPEEEKQTSVLTDMAGNIKVSADNSKLQVDSLSRIDESTAATLTVNIAGKKVEVKPGQFRPLTPDDVKNFGIKNFGSVKASPAAPKTYEESTTWGERAGSWDPSSY